MNGFIAPCRVTLETTQRLSRCMDWTGPIGEKLLMIVWRLSYGNRRQMIGIRSDL
jgi:hypothetical protein